MVYTKGQQILLPKKVYIGDTAELRFTFNSSATLVEQNTSFVNNPGLFTTEPGDKDFVIQNVQLRPAGVNYFQLSITFVPWKTGPIQLPDYVIQNKDGQEISIHFEPVNIVSLTQNTQKETGFVDNPAAPVLLPGTAYKLWGILIIFVLILIAGIRLIIKRKEVSFYLKNKKLIKKYKKNKKQAIKKLNLLSIKSGELKVRGNPSILPDQDFAAEIQKIMRNYLSVRFERPFTNVVTSELVKNFSLATEGLASEAKMDSIGDISGIFIRTDYIRYSAGGVFLKDEKLPMLKKLIEDIEILEAEEKNV